MKVELANIYGQKIAELYNGKAGDVNTVKVLDLPEIASGIYFIYVYENGVLDIQQKLFKIIYTG